MCSLALNEIIPGSTVSYVQATATVNKFITRFLAIDSDRNPEEAEEFRTCLIYGPGDEILRTFYAFAFSSEVWPHDLDFEITYAITAIQLFFYHTSGARPFATIKNATQPSAPIVLSDSEDEDEDSDTTIAIESTHDAQYGKYKKQESAVHYYECYSSDDEDEEETMVGTCAPDILEARSYASDEESMDSDSGDSYGTGSISGGTPPHEPTYTLPIPVYEEFDGIYSPIHNPEYDGPAEGRWTEDGDFMLRRGTSPTPSDSSGDDFDGTVDYP